MKTPSLPTVRIADPDNDGDFLVINEADFDPEQHERFEESASVIAKLMADPAETGADGPAPEAGAPSEAGDAPGPDPDDLTQVTGIGDGVAMKLAAAGIETFAALIEADPEAVAGLFQVGVSANVVKGWQSQATALAA